MSSRLIRCAQQKPLFQPLFSTFRRSLQTTSSRKPPNHRKRRITATSSSRNLRQQKERQRARRREEELLFAQLNLQVALLRMNGLMNLTTNENYDMSVQYPHLSQFLQDCASNCRIAPSTMPNAGFGLFAAQNICQGNIISLYPAHLLGMEANDYDDSSLVAYSNPADELYFDEQPNMESSCGNKLFIVQADESTHYRPVDYYDQHDSSSSSDPTNNVIVYLDVNPNHDLPTNKAWLSHFINDGANITSDNYVNNKEDEEESVILEYYEETNQRRNTFHIPFGPSPLMATVATRDIKQGEEFFTSYDFLYWIMDVLEEGNNNNLRKIKRKVTITEPIGHCSGAMDRAFWESTKGVAVQYEKEIDEIKAIFDSMQQPNLD